MYLTRLHLAQAPIRTPWTQRRLIQQLTSPELRSRFLNYFEKQQHVPVKSASLVPHNDKSLLFTNAGMVPFKDFFLKPDTAPFKAATSVQKCMRAGGKHNDLDNVGYTARHHTFFEMLGNFSFGQYTKKDAIRYAWRFLVDELKLPLSRLRVTILEGDEEGYKLWKNEGLTDDMIVRCGEEDNFWSMGDGEGPCGPCTEIFWDTQDDTLDERWLEIWNLVFMENYRGADGKLTKLPIPCIDTGMGLERMVCVLQGKNNNFQTDQFEILIGGLRRVMKSRGIESLSSVDPSPHEKIIADHFRAMCFLIGDGVVPSNVGRGYVLRRIIRRALRSARQLGIHEPFLTDLYPHLLAGFEDGSYPELTSRASSIQSVVTNEERSFLATLDRGMALLDNVFSQPDLQKSKTIPPSIAFQLYDTFGFPFDLTLIIAQEKGWTVDIQEWRNKNIMPKFSGYDRSMMHQTSEIVAVEPVVEGKMSVNMAIDPCPFYGLGGGQVADTGYITLANGQRWDVVDVFQPYDGCLALKLAPDNIANGETIESLIERDQEFFQIGQKIEASVNTENRQGAEVHHTATHVLNAGLRSVLKSDIVQAGSTVETQKLRFDFTYGKPLTPSQLQSIEEWVNEAALNGGAMSHMKLVDAIKMGAVATFSEKYGEVVRVVEVEGVSKELCGGTHVDDIRKLYPFKILTETSVAAGTRRIEAVAGLSCVKWYRNAYEPVPEVLRMLRANTTDEMIGKLEKTMQQTKDLQKRLDFMTEKLASAGEVVISPVEATMKDILVKIHLVDPELDASYMQKRANVLKESQSDSAHILINGNNIVVALDAKKIKQETANTILRHVLKHVKGGGGGQKEYAQGRIAEPIRDVQTIESKIVAALQKA
ncbi:alanyl-tRNA synthetase [Phycomyces nitens]|nr:alanyl-tRNA synthetase [Phycomyces nitens]